MERLFQLSRHIIIVSLSVKNEVKKNLGFNYIGLMGHESATHLTKPQTRNHVKQGGDVC